MGTESGTLTKEQFDNTIKALRDLSDAQLCCSVLELVKKNPDLPIMKMIKYIRTETRNVDEYLRKQGVLFNEKDATRKKEELKRKEWLAEDDRDWMSSIISSPDYEKVLLNNKLEKKGIKGQTFTQIVFKGHKEEIRKLVKYLEDNKATWEMPEMSEDSIYLINVSALDKVQKMLAAFPALKVAALSEYAKMGTVLAWFSPSGADSFVMNQEVGEFDGIHEGGNGRWAWECNIFSEIHKSFVWMQTGETCFVDYKYPYLEEWNDDKNYYEVEGAFYRLK